MQHWFNLKYVTNTAGATNNSAYNNDANKNKLIELKLRVNMRLMLQSLEETPQCCNIHTAV